MGTRLFQTMYTADQMRKAVADERERIKAANAPEIERINTYIKKLEACIQARGNT